MMTMRAPARTSFMELLICTDSGTRIGGKIDRILPRRDHRLDQIGFESPKPNVSGLLPLSGRAIVIASAVPQPPAPMIAIGRLIVIRMKIIVVPVVFLDLIVHGAGRLQVL